VRPPVAASTITAWTTKFRSDEQQSLLPKTRLAPAGRVFLLHQKRCLFLRARRVWIFAIFNRRLFPIADRTKMRIEIALDGTCTTSGYSFGGAVMKMVTVRDSTQTKVGVFRVGSGRISAAVRGFGGERTKAMFVVYTLTLVRRDAKGAVVEVETDGESLVEWDVRPVAVS